MCLCRSAGDRHKSRLTIDITDRQRQSLNTLAGVQGKTITQSALERLLPGDVDADQAWQELKTLLETRISNGLAGKVSAKSVGEILDEELARSPATEPPERGNPID